MGFGFGLFIAHLQRFRPYGASELDYLSRIYKGFALTGLWRWIVYRASTKVSPLWGLDLDYLSRIYKGFAPTGLSPKGKEQCFMMINLNSLRACTIVSTIISIRRQIICRLQSPSGATPLQSTSRILQGPKPRRGDTFIGNPNLFARPHDLFKALYLFVLFEGIITHNIVKT